ncbi:hypothetical protein ACJX0J_021904, partial [Zea mays]
MTMQYHWDDEVIAQFYATLWIKFAHILGFSDEDISDRHIRIHDIQIWGYFQHAHVLFNLFKREDNVFDMIWEEIAYGVSFITPKDAYEEFPASTPGVMQEEETLMKMMQEEEALI